MKFSSNVIEKCLDGSNSKIQETILQTLLTEDEDIIGDLLVDSFGNYVIQKAVDVSKGHTFVCILDKISKNFHKLSQLPFGNKLSQKLVTLYPELKSFICKDNSSLNNSLNPNYISSTNGKLINSSKRTVNSKNSKTTTPNQNYKTLSNINNIQQVGYQGNFVPFYPIPNMMPNPYFLQQSPYLPMSFNQMNHVWNQNYYNQMNPVNQMNSNLNQMNNPNNQNTQHPGYFQINNFKNKKN